MKIIISLLFISIFLFSNEKTENINLYLKWTHSFQFAGYYAAQKQGYYKDANLSVKIIENKDKNKNRLSYILKQQNFYAIETPRILLDKRNRNKIKILSVIFQHSPLVVVTLRSSNIKSPQQFSNKKIMGLGISAELKAMIKKEGGDFNNIKFITKKDWSYKLLLNHEVDIVPGYITSLPYKLNKENIEYNMIRAIDYGIDFYGDFIITSNKEVNNHPKRVERFISASKKGWEYAMTHKVEMINYILKKYKADNTYDSLLYEANVMEKDIMMSNFIEIGHMNLGRWKHIEKILKDLELVDSNFNITNFIYSKKEASIWENKYFIYLMYSLIIITLIAFISFIFNLKLNKKVQDKIKEITEKEDLFKAIFNNNFQYTGILDLSGRLLLANKASLSVINKEEKDVLGKYFWKTPWFEHSGEQQKKIENSVKLLKKEKEFIRFETTLKSHDGKLIFVDFSIKLAKNDEGIVNSYIVEGRDITNYKNLEMRVNTAQKMESIGVLAAGIAHDFNNIISAIVSNVELVKMDLNDKKIDELNEIIKASKRAKKLVTRIISFTKGTKEEKKNVNLISLIDGIIKLTRPTIKNNNINIEFNYKNNAPINVVYTQIEQVIMNITRNALQAIDKSGTLTITIDTIETKEELILVDSVLPINKYLKVVIKDTGSGISKDNLTRIFEPYFSTKNKKDGTGLGLFVVHGIMNKHDSYIDVKSELNKGSVFELYFPISSYDFDEIRTSSRNYNGINNMKGKHILFVDDEKIITKSMSKILIKKGFIVDSFNDSEKAYSFFKKNFNKYDIIITDQNMPNLTGVELSSKIRNINKNIPIILCSGYNSIVDSSNISDYYISEYMEKPIMINELVMNINYLLTKNS